MRSSLPGSAAPLSLLTDFYELTMAYGYWRTGLLDREAVFHLYFRRNPFQGGFTIACGLGPAVEMLRVFRFDKDSLGYLQGLRGPSGGELFDPEFLAWLGELRLTCDIDAVTEGTAVFPHEPLVRVQGPLVECQLLETALLNIFNFSSLIATKSARVNLAAEGDTVIEFGVRRAQGFDGGVTASRAAFVGGCESTSNVLAGKLHGIPVRGTHAHSWVMAFPSESEAFDRYVEALPDNAVLLVDTYDTIEGTRHAIEAGRKLRSRGYDLKGVRLDSGDLAALGREVRQMLDAAGFTKTAIVGSGDLDEYAIADLKRRGAPIHVWGVGTKLATAYDEPALGGVYKLAAIRQKGSPWSYRLKLTDDPEKASIPGVLGVHRFSRSNSFLADVIYPIGQEIVTPCSVLTVSDRGRRMDIPSTGPGEDLLVPVLRRGEIVFDPPPIEESQARTRAQLASLPEALTEFTPKEVFPVGLHEGTHELRERLVAQATPASLKAAP